MDGDETTEQMITVAMLMSKESGVKTWSLSTNVSIAIEDTLMGES